ncbi:MAG: hypothetical protein AAGA46_07610 [Cyanobacteria bacterium P01_F01_bin.13]
MFFFLFATIFSETAWGISEDFDPEFNDQPVEVFSSLNRPLILEQDATTAIEPGPSSTGLVYLLETQATLRSTHPKGADENDNPDVLYLAAPENLNPGLYIPPPVAPEPEPVEPAESVTPELDPTAPESNKTPFVPFWEVDDLTVNLSDDFSNFDQSNQIIEPTVTGTLPNGDALAITTGFNRYSQPDVDTVFNMPLKAAWTREMGNFTTTIGGGVDFFNQLPLAINFNANTSVPIGKKATLSFFVDNGPYKFNATTLNNQIKAWRYGPNLYWQITPDMYLFSLLRWGRYNDGNQEQQSFSRVEQKLGDFHVAGNLFTWRYREDAESASGYFSPPDFLVASAEVGWKGEVLEWLDCGAAASWGQQRLNSSWSSAYSYNTKCTFEISESLEMDLGYAFSNVIGQTGSSAFNNRAITGQVRAKF